MNYSFEFFPSRTEGGIPDLISIMKQFEEFNPRFFSVTCSEKGPSLTNKVVERAVNELDTPVAPHITCVNKTEQEIEDLIGFYKELGVDSCVAVRGDLPDGEESHPGYYSYAVNLVERLSKDFSDITVASYPQGIDGKGRPDLDILVDKYEAGATRTITQFFYGYGHFLPFRESFDKLDIHMELVPGILPVSDYYKVQRFAAKCNVPLPISFQNYSILGMCNILKKTGETGMHFYTLNNFTTTADICRELENSK